MKQSIVLSYFPSLNIYQVKKLVNRLEPVVGSHLDKFAVDILMREAKIITGLSVEIFCEGGRRK